MSRFGERFSSMTAIGSGLDLVVFGSGFGGFRQRFMMPRGITWLESIGKTRNGLTKFIKYSATNNVGCFE